jgi:predicted NAD-dependent protein-ADP-ribosyltransferase YbiA (DUF1768 family)
MDIRSGKGYPASTLSNFAPHPFEIDSVQCNSMEGFLQSLKFKNPEMQKHVCTLVGFAAKEKGRKKRWEASLWWQGKQIDRFTREYQALLDKAYNALSKNEKFRKALLSTRDASLTHSVGKKKESETILTEREFCGRLLEIRNRLQKAEKEYNDTVSDT